jgi:hypothetical protein
MSTLELDYAPGQLATILPAAAPTWSTAPVNDGWINTISGLGTERDRRAQYSIQSNTELTDQALETLYNENWLARRIVELLPQQAFRKEPTGIDAAQKKIWQDLDEHELYTQGVFLQGLFTGRTFGGSVILVGFVHGDPLEPAPKPGPLSAIAWLDVVPWQMLTVEAKETDANSKRFGLPSVLRVTGQHPRNGLRFHISRCVICEGAARALPSTATNRRPWLSVLQAVHETLRDYDVSWGSISNLLEESSIGVMKLQGLFKMLASKDQSVAQARMQVMAQSKSMVHTLFLDADGNESFDRTEVSFAALPQLMQQINLRTSGAAGLPAAKLFGMEPAGLNATGESDIRNCYDDAAEYRSRAALKLQKLMSWALGKEIKLEWPALWELTDKEKAEARFINAQADKIWSVDIGALTAEDIGVSRSKDGSFGIDVDPSTIAEEIAEQAAKEQVEQERALAEQQQSTAPQGNNAPPAPIAPID